MIRLLFQGDSITDGNRYKDPASRWDLNHQIGHSYVFPIVGTLGKKYVGKFQFINRGVSGDRVSTIAERWQTDTLDENPDILSILLGTNGNGAFETFTKEEIEAHLNEFDSGYRALLDATLARNPDVRFILIEPFSLPTGARREHYDTFFAVFERKQAIIRRIAEDYRAVWVPVQEKLERLAEETAAVFVRDHIDLDPMAYWLWDGVHPTEPMHCVLADLWLEATADLLEQCVRADTNG